MQSGSHLVDFSSKLWKSLAGSHGLLAGVAVSLVHVPLTLWNPGVLIVFGSSDKPEDLAAVQSILHSLESALILTPSSFGEQSSFALVPSTMH